jgi:very-short-patch-repair endonuclease
MTALAAAAGGRLDCVSALAAHGVWSGVLPPGLHVRAEPHQHTRKVPGGARVHWSATRAPSSDPAEVSPVDALLQSIDCLPPLDALASVESALHLGYLSERGLDSLAHHGSLQVRQLLDRLDRGAQSGFETHTRVKLLDAGYRVRTQVHVPGAGRLDLLVESCVGIETDGAAWHGPDRFIHDRTKDLVVEGHGIRVLRIARPHIFEEWPRTLATIDRMVQDARAATSENRGRGRRMTR